MSPELILGVQFQIGQLDITVNSLRDVLARRQDLSREEAVFADVATHSFYNGIVRCLWMLCKGSNIPLPAGDMLHTEMLNMATES